MLFALDICVNKKAPPTHSVYWGLNHPSPPHLKNITPSFAKSPLKSANYPKHPFLAIHPPKKNNNNNHNNNNNNFFMHPSQKQKTIINSELL